MPIPPTRYALAIASALLVAGTSSSGQSPQRTHPGPINLAVDRDQYMLETGHSVGCLRPGVESSCRMIDTLVVDYSAADGTSSPALGAPDYHTPRSVSRGPTYVVVFKRPPPEDGIPRIRYTGPPAEYENGRPVIFSSSSTDAKAGICGRNMIVVEIVDYASTFKSSDCPGAGG